MSVLSKCTEVKGFSNQFIKYKIENIQFRLIKLHIAKNVNTQKYKKKQQQKKSKQSNAKAIQTGNISAKNINSLL